ncbi:MAG: PQQ-binding-like beta-propeller repeat protein [Proteobacteria bacterium]|nr:PQQ-binding-like beta-propeller repeat protein [Pseudomonadota bacterium]
MRIREKQYSFRAAHILLLSFLSSIASGSFAVFTVASTVENFDTAHCAYTPYLSCTDTQTGETLWHNSLYSDPDSFVVRQSQLYVSHSTHSSSYDLRTGRQTWRASTDSDAHYFYPVISGENVFLARTDGMLEKRQADSGKIIWTRALANGWIYPPLIHQNKIISGGQNRTIWVLDSKTGQTLDSFALQQELVAPLFQTKNGFVASTFDGRLSAYRLNLKTGKAEPVWQARLENPAFSYLSDSRYLVTADMSGKLSSFDPETGRQRWQKSVHRNALFWNVLYQQSLISLTESGSLMILDTQSGKLQKQMQFDHRYVQAPVIQGDRVALYDITGAVEHLNPESLPLNSRQRHPAPRT